MEGVISYRPSMGKKKLMEAVEKLHFDNTNQFIDFAVMSALMSRDNPKVKKLMAELAGVIYQNAPLRFVKPTPREDKEIRRRFAEMKKGKSITMHPLKIEPRIHARALRRPKREQVEEQHRRGYQNHPVTQAEVGVWEKEQAWGEKAKKTVK